MGPRRDALGGSTRNGQPSTATAGRPDKRSYHPAWRHSVRPQVRLDDARIPRTSGCAGLRSASSVEDDHSVGSEPKTAGRGARTRVSPDPSDREVSTSLLSALSRPAAGSSRAARRLCASSARLTAGAAPERSDAAGKRARWPPDEREPLLSSIRYAALSPLPRRRASPTNPVESTVAPTITVANVKAPMASWLEDVTSRAGRRWAARGSARSGHDVLLGREEEAEMREQRRFPGPIRRSGRSGNGATRRVTSSTAWTGRGLPTPGLARASVLLLPSSSHVLESLLALVMPCQTAE